jgi:uncharacterized membrane protein
MNSIWILVSILVLAFSPYLAFLIMKYGSYGYFMAKRKAQRKGVEPTCNNRNDVD